MGQAVEGAARGIQRLAGTVKKSAALSTTAEVKKKKKQHRMSLICFDDKRDFIRLTMHWSSLLRRVPISTRLNLQLRSINTCFFDDSKEFRLISLSLCVGWLIATPARRFASRSGSTAEPCRARIRQSAARTRRHGERRAGQARRRLAQRRRQYTGIGQRNKGKLFLFSDF